MPQFKFAEFFAGGGMARAGLGDKWDCVFANDIDAMKCATYRANWNASDLIECDIADLPATALQKETDLYWASSPCQDFSLAGAGHGLGGRKSSVFYPWMEHVKKAVNGGYAPRIIAFENVTGLLSSNAGQDFAAVVAAFTELGYFVGATIVDARKFLPQSRPRLFVIAVKNTQILPEFLAGAPEDNPYAQISKAYDALPKRLKSQWIWWKFPERTAQIVPLSEIVNNSEVEQKWFSDTQTQRLISLMNDTHRAKLAGAQKSGKLVVGTIYKRGRPDESGNNVQRAELRLDGVAGCLRTPRGGSSRQTVMFIHGKKVKARLLSKQEAARLMGLPNSYILPERYNDAYLLAGDGVAVPVVRFLAESIFEPVLKLNSAQKAA